MNSSEIYNLITLNFDLIILLVLGGILAIHLFIFLSYKNGSALFILEKMFKVNTPFFEKGYQSGTIDVWGKGKNKYHVNSMDIKVNKVGIQFKGTLLNPYIGAFLIPWDNLKYIEQENGFIFSKNNIFEVCESGLFISIPEEFKMNN